VGQDTLYSSVLLHYARARIFQKRKKSATNEDEGELTDQSDHTDSFINESDDDPDYCPENAKKQKKMTTYFNFDFAKKMKLNKINDARSQEEQIEPEASGTSGR